MSYLPLGNKTTVGGGGGGGEAKNQLRVATEVCCAAETIRSLEDRRGWLYPTWCAAMLVGPALAANALAVVSASYEDNSEEPVRSQNGGRGVGGRRSITILLTRIIQSISNGYTLLTR